MGEKDITEKILEDYNDIFSDIMNVLLFDGRQVVKPEELSESITRSHYKADDGSLHEQERDVAKYWKQCNIELAVCGIENQTHPERNMVLRVAGYEGASYRSQYMNGKKPIPVVTVVLYFGNDHWTEPKSLRELMEIPDGLDEYVNDCKIHVFEIAHLDEETVRKFRSDFGIVADFFVNKRKNPDWVPDDKRQIVHVDAVLKLLSAMTKDVSYKNLIDLKEGGPKNMCEVAERLKESGRAEGREEGREVTFFELVQGGVISAEFGAEKLHMTILEFEKRMTALGYKIPENV